MLVWHLLTDSPVGRTRLELEHFAIQYVQFLTALEWTNSFLAGAVTRTPLGDLTELPQTL